MIAAHHAQPSTATPDSIAVCVVQYCTALLLACAPMAAMAQSPADADTTSSPLRAIGLSVVASGGPRDTLGLLVSVVTRDGPADQAGITAGSRILAINGLPMRLAAGDVGQRAAADSAVTRFARALRVTPPESAVTLRVAGGGQTRTVSLAQRGRTPAVAVQVVIAPVVATPVVRAPVAAAPAVAPPVVAAPAVASPVVAAPAVVTPVVAAPVGAARLVALEAELTNVLRKLHQLYAADSAVAQRDSGRMLVAGLELGRISGDLATFLGEQADSALLVRQASADWEPVRVGDVVLQVDGARPEASRLHAAIEARRAVTLVLLRRGRTFTVSIGPHAAP